MLPEVSISHCGIHSTAANTHTHASHTHTHTHSKSSVTCSAATLFLTEGHIADAASFSTFALAPYAAYQKRQLKDLGGLRGQHNALRETVNGLTAQNNILDGSIDTLALQVNK